MGTEITSFEFLFLILCICYLVFGVDDFFIDVYYWMKKKNQLFIDSFTMDLWKQKSHRRRFAIMVACWKEYEVLARMIEGNIIGIKYRDFDFFIGVYPNDLETVRVATDLAQKYDNVHVVINPIEGPTCKGQMLNEVVQGIRDYEKLKHEIHHEIHYDGFIIHDCEDIIHPYSLHLYNNYVSQYDFIQIPIFSLPTPITNLVAGTYMDEFAELHLKDILVRGDLGASVPSAGVGTAVSRRLVNQLLLKQNGKILNIGSLTEDYEMGVTTGLHGFKSRFICSYFENSQGKKEYIATRAYFPMKMWSSVRQKTRWVLGIAFQGWEHLGWFGSLADRYFLYRDRKGPISNVLALLGMIFLFVLIARGGVNLNNGGHLIFTLCLINLFFMTNRMVQRIYFSSSIYGVAMGFLAPLRIVMGNIINATASLRAFSQYLNYRVTGVAPRWVKTDHQLLEGFGENVVSASVSASASASTSGSVQQIANRNM